MQGTLIKGIAGFYYVKTDKGIYECHARGKFRHRELTPVIGDIVEITLVNNIGSIEKICERKNELIRPSVANVTQAIIIITIKNPELDYKYINKLLILCEFKKIKIVVGINKIDLINDQKNLDNLINMLDAAGYRYVLLRAEKDYGINNILELLPHNLSVLCGPSGVGKSTIINKLSGKEIMETGELSNKLKKGKHTTRYTELVEINNGLLADTPGFSSIDINFLKKQEIADCFPEFAQYKDGCKFSGCYHHHEPSCSIKEAVNEGKISKIRYDFYIETLEKINGGKKK